MKWIIYLFSLTEPKQALIVQITEDSVTYYRDSYEAKEIIYRDLDHNIYAFHGGFVHVGGKYVSIEFTNGRRKYKIKRIAKL